MKKWTGMVLAGLLLLTAGCGGGDDQTGWLQDLFSHIYKNRKTDIYQQRMQPILIDDLKLKRYRLFQAASKLADKLNGVQLVGTKQFKKGKKLYVSGLIRENYFKGRRKYRTFLAKFVSRPGQGENPPLWIMYDLILLEGKKLQRIPELLKATTVSAATAELARRITGKTVCQVFDDRAQSLTTHLFKEIASYNPANLTMTYYNPDIERGTAGSYGIQSKGYLVIEQGKYSYRIKTADLYFNETDKNEKKQLRYQGERILAVALYRTAIQQLTLRYVTGIGQRRHTGSKLPSLTSLYRRLNRFGFKTETGSLNGIHTKSSNTVLLLAHPRRSLAIAQQRSLQKFIRDGGRAVFLIERPVPRSFVQLLAGWGIGIIPNKTIVDPPRKDFIKGPAWFRSTPLPALPTRLFANQPDFNVLFSMVTGLKLLKKQSGKEKWAPHALIATTSNSWAETVYDDEKPGEVGYTRGWDIKGPIDIAFSVNSEATNNAAQGKAVVIGDADFISNRHFETNVSNWVFLKELLNWLCGAEYFKLDTLPVKKSLQLLWK